jgi:hypothetical protein
VKRVLKIMPIMVLVLAMMLILSGCEIEDLIFPVEGDRPGDVGSPDEGPPSRAVKELDGLKLVLETAKEAYPLGEPIPLKFELINTGSTPVEFTFSSGQRFDFLVKKGERTIWRWSFGKQFIQVLGQITLEPGQSLSFEADWPQVDNLGNAVPPGEYVVLALLTSIEPLESAPLVIRIR